MEFHQEKDGFGQWERLYGLDGKRVYRFPELHAAEAVLQEAQRRWTAASRAYIEKEGDNGTCVLGNGLAVAVRPPRARNAYRLLICHPMGQSEGPGWATKDPIIAYLKAHGIECWYECGRMD